MAQADIRTGYLFIADITGYTVYLSESELDHAQGTLTTLLEVLVAHSGPPLVLTRLAGDAAISYALADDVPGGQTFLEMIERCYVDFRQAVETMVLNNTCRCNACANVSSLDLKFFLHFGEFALQRVAGAVELVGNDVNLIHRLLKNNVTEQTGVRAYTLLTEAAVAALGLGEAAPSMVPHRETVEGVGVIPARILDMHPVWDDYTSRPRHQITPTQRLVEVSTDMAMPAPVLWEYLNIPEFRSTLMASDSTQVEGRVDGRIGAGSTYVCFHGAKAIRQRITEWRPFEHLAVATAIGGVEAPMTLRLEPIGPGDTRLTQTLGKVQGPLPKRLFFNTMLRFNARAARRDLEAFKAHVEADLAGRGGMRAGAGAAPSAGDIAAAAEASLGGEA
jgi:hypothetical protein